MFLHRLLFSHREHTCIKSVKKPSNCRGESCIACIPKTWNQFANIKENMLNSKFDVFDIQYGMYLLVLQDCFCCLYFHLCFALVKKKKFCLNPENKFHIEYSNIEYLLNMQLTIENNYHTNRTILITLFNQTVRRQ